MASEFHRKALEQSTSEYIEVYVKHSMDILDRINELFQEKLQGNLKLLAEKLDETEEQVNDWLHGVQNYSIMTISKFEVAFGTKII